VIWKKIFIYKHAHHIMKFEVLLESSHIIKYMYRPPDSVSVAPINITTASVDLN
jgi:hypothetical protein